MRLLKNINKTTAKDIMIAYSKSTIAWSLSEIKRLRNEKHYHNRTFWVKMLITDIRRHRKEIQNLKKEL